MQDELEKFAQSSPAAISVAKISESALKKHAVPAMSIDARFEIGSLTKVFTGTLLGILVEAGEIDPNASVNDFLQNPLPWKDRAPTLRELATHRSGLPNTPNELFWREAAIALGFSLKDPWRDVDQEKYKLLLQKAARKASIRTRPAYSSMGVGLLGEALAQAMGVNFASLLQKRVLDPLGMSSTGFDKPQDGPRRVEQPMNRKSKPLPYLVDQMPAAGMLATTTEDLSKLIRATWGDGPEEVVAGLRRALTPTADFGPIKIGYCWLIMQNDSQETVAFHTGGTWGSTSLIEVNLDKRDGWVSLSASYRDLDKLTTKLKMSKA